MSIHLTIRKSLSRLALVCAVSLLPFATPAAAKGGCCSSKSGVGGNGGGDAHAAHQTSEPAAAPAAEAEKTGTRPKAERKQTRRRHGNRSAAGNKGNTSADERAIPSAKPAPEGQTEAKGAMAGCGGGESGCCAMMKSDGHSEGNAATGDGPSPREAMGLIHALLDGNKAIRRTVVRTEDGVKTTTTTTDPDLLPVLRKHPAQMKEFLAEGRAIRQWDPLFRELFSRRDAIRMEVREVENGVEVIETSADPEVVKLIQAHADKVSEFVARGRAAMHESTDVPEGYKATADPHAHH